MRFILGGRVEFAAQVSPYLGVRLDMPPQPGRESWRYVAVSTSCLDTEYIGLRERCG